MTKKGIACLLRTDRTKHKHLFISWAKLWPSSRHMSGVESLRPQSRVNRLNEYMRHIYNRVYGLVTYTNIVLYKTWVIRILLWHPPQSVYTPNYKQMYAQRYIQNVLLDYSCFDSAGKERIHFCYHTDAHIIPATVVTSSHIDLFVLARVWHKKIICLA